MQTNNQKIDLGIGVVAENSKYGEERNIFAVPLRLVPNVKGELGFTPYEITTSGIDAKGMSYLDKIKSQSAVTATWWSTESNRITPPQLRKGELVRLFKEEGDDRIFFSPSNQNLNLRHQETVITAVAAKPMDDHKDIIESNAGNTYSQTMDGVNGLCEIRMADANGEVSPWILQMDGKKGIFTLTDQKNNIITVDTTRTTISLTNADRSTVTLDKKVITVQAPDTVNILADNIVNIKAGKTLNIEAPTINMKCDKKTLKASNVNWSISSGFKVNCPQTTFSGHVTMGSFSTSGGGGGSVGGSMQVGGGMSVGGAVKLNGGTSSGVIYGSYIDT